MQNVEFVAGEDQDAVITITLASDDPDGINGLNYFDENDAIYTLQGVKVNGKNLSKGIYIINGKKVFVNK